mgnify:CR=1 FL=1
MEYSNDLIDLQKVNSEFGELFYSKKFMGCFIQTRTFDSSGRVGTVRRTVEVDDKFPSSTMILSEFKKKHSGSVIEDIAAFHPDGRSGCIEKNDDYFFNSRANHFIVISGWVEGLGESIPVFLIICNHKGNLAETLVEPILDENTEEQN